MKKLMVAVAAIACAVVANAAQVKWSVEDVAGVTGGDSTGDLALFFCADSLSYENAVSYLSQGKLSSLTGYLNSGITDEGYADHGYAGDYTKGTDKDFYVVLLNVDDESDITKATKYIVSEPLPKHVPDNDANFGAYLSVKGQTWADVAPEPTSGLLLLVGVAGLALRRRRA